MKKSTHKLTESIEEQHFKKKFLERKLQEKDADKQIKDYRPKEVSYPQPVDKARSM